MNGFKITLILVVAVMGFIECSIINRKQGQNEIEVIEKSSGNCECEECSCVPFYRCNEDGREYTDGTGLIDIRINREVLNRTKRESSCGPYFHVCCSGPIVPKPVIEPSKITSCGRRNYDGIGIRITNLPTEESQYGEFPWMAAVLQKVIIDGETTLIYLSGGSLIQPNIILTAAHHVYKAKQNNETLIVRVGEWDSSIDTELFPHEDVVVEKIILHNDFNRGNLHNDFALLILEKSVNIGENIGTICLPNGEDDFYHDDCVATGWGKDRFGIEGSYQPVLKLVSLPLVDRDSCQSALRTTRLGGNFILDDSLRCAGGELGKDTCQGDGGSPLVCRSNKDPSRYVVVGLVAYGIGCGEDGIPGVYADVANNDTLKWIENELTVLDL